MAKYKVICNIPVQLTIAVQANNDAEAIEKAVNDYAFLSDYSGNGALQGKLIGTRARNVQIKASEFVLEGSGWETTAEKVG